MNSIEATIRNTKSKGEVNALRVKGIVPGIIYGGKDANQKVSISKKEIKILVVVLPEQGFWCFRKSQKYFKMGNCVGSKRD